MRYPAQNLSKNTRYVENMNKKSSFFHSSSKINNYYFIIFLWRPILDLKFPLMGGSTSLCKWRTSGVDREAEKLQGKPK